MGASLQRSGGTLTGSYVVEIDTHALAGSGGTDTHAVDVVVNAATTPESETGVDTTTDTCNTLSMAANTSEQVVIPDNTILIGTPSNAQNVIFGAMGVYVKNAGASASTFTWRIRLDTSSGTILASLTTSSIATTAVNQDSLSGTLSDQSVAAHDLNFTVQRNTNAQAYRVFCTCFGRTVSGSLSGSAPTDTHSLGGSLTPSSDTHACS